MQLNSKSMKQFRNILGAYKVATYTVADELLQKNEKVKALRVLIASNNKIIEKIDNGETTLKSKEDCEKENEQYLAKIADAIKDLEKVREAQKEAIDKAMALVTEELISAYEKYISDIYSVEAEESLEKAFVKWFTDNGATDCTVESVRPYIKVLGGKLASAKALAKNGKFVVAQNKKTVAKILLGAICDEPTLAKMLPTYKWIITFENISK